MAPLRFYKRLLISAETGLKIHIFSFKDVFMVLLFFGLEMKSNL